MQNICKTNLFNDEKIELNEYLSVTKSFEKLLDDLVDSIDRVNNLKESIDFVRGKVFKTIDDKIVGKINIRICSNDEIEQAKAIKSLEDDLFLAECGLQNAYKAMKKFVKNL